MPIHVADIATILSGSTVGFILALVGGGGSILAVPLLVYGVGVASPHVAIGTSAIAVAVSAFANMIAHWTAGNVRWPCAVVFSLAGVAGAFAGASVAKQIDGQNLLVFFAILMLVVAGLMLAGRSAVGNEGVQLNRRNVPKLLALGLATGGLSGFFGIGGGFLIVPGLMLATGMPILNAVTSSLVAVAAFGVTAAANYALSGFVDWRLAAIFIGGGVFGGIAGAQLAATLGKTRGRLNIAFAAVIFAVAIYMLVRAAGWF